MEVVVVEAMVKVGSWEVGISIGIDNDEEEEEPMRPPG